MQGTGNWEWYLIIMTEGMKHRKAELCRISNKILLKDKVTRATD